MSKHQALPAPDAENARVELQGYGRDAAEFGRSLGFFDAVYAFALTLLVTNIDLPAPAAWESPAALLNSDFSDQAFGFLVSFAVIAVFWRTNHQLLARLSAVTGTVIWANLGVALFVIFIPFSTQAMSEPPTSSFPLAVTLYAVNVALAVLAQMLMFQLAARAGLETVPTPPRARRIEALAALDVPVIMLASISLAYFVGTDAARLSWLLLIPTGILLGRWSETQTRRIAAAAVTAAAAPAAAPAIAAERGRIR